MYKITSMQNQLVKTWKKLLTSKGRKKEKAYMIESWHLVEEALKTDLVQYCMLTQEMYAKYGEQISVPMYIITDEIVGALTQTQSPQAIFAVVKMADEVVDLQLGKYMLLDAVQDPGNLGTIIRTADAAGFDAVILGDGCVDSYNDKALRAMQGSQFHIAIIKMNLIDAIQRLKAQQITIYGTELNEYAQSLFDLSPSQHFALVVGNEGNGVQREHLDLVDKIVYIPIFGQAESLNVTVAAGIAMYHLIEK